MNNIFILTTNVVLHSYGTRITSGPLVIWKETLLCQCVMQCIHIAQAKSIFSQIYWHSSLVLMSRTDLPLTDKWWQTENCSYCSWHHVVHLIIFWEVALLKDLTLFFQLISMLYCDMSRLRFVPKTFLELWFTITCIVSIVIHTTPNFRDIDLHWEFTIHRHARFHIGWSEKTSAIITNYQSSTVSNSPLQILV